MIGQPCERERHRQHGCTGTRTAPFQSPSPRAFGMNLLRSAGHGKRPHTERARNAGGSGSTHRVQQCIGRGGSRANVLWCCSATQGGRRPSLQTGLRTYLPGALWPTRVRDVLGFESQLVLRRNGAMTGVARLSSIKLDKFGGREEGGCRCEQHRDRWSYVRQGGDGKVIVVMIVGPPVYFRQEWGPVSTRSRALDRL